VARRNLIPVSKPQPIPPRPDQDQNDPPVSEEELDIIRERLARPEGPTRPWSEVYAEQKARAAKPQPPR
jgi:hypothetical protein